MLFLLTIVGCSEQSEVGQSEVGQSEVGQSEAGQSEAGQSEAGQSEAGQSEAAQSEATDSEGTLRLQEQLMSAMKSVTDAQNEVASEAINNVFDDASEQYRQTFIDQTLEHTEEINEGSADSLAEKFERIKEVEHAPVDDFDE